MRVRLTGECLLLASLSYFKFGDLFVVFHVLVLQSESCYLNTPQENDANTQMEIQNCQITVPWSLFNNNLMASTINIRVVNMCMRKSFAAVFRTCP